ncbi:hypothetical protein jhhlp_002146 [Lomentospora prolificans]|uniref:Nudix hydrolase domain-containing protein n=1 Tax=Lomentospora prolificans TaxID=41688 RepID=A0A2N3ND79_9PEZI|nr:hypothetical protein jhhlp_002146 [Lomentospora prolificans]
MSGTKMQLEDWLDDLCVRFIINLPQEDLSSVPRICFQVEEAQWFYEDFIRPLDPTLPSMSLRTFCLRIFQHCPLLTTFPVGAHIQAFEEFLQYKTRIPVRGAILLNEAMDSVLLVRGWKKGANWSFPRGKINKDEDDLDCAIREVYEETGFDIRDAGLVASQKETKFIEVTMRDQQIRLYVFRDVPMDTQFQPRTRKEISKIQWYKLSDLPAFRKKGQGSHGDSGGNAANNANKFYMVAPFLVQLKKWIVQQQKRDVSRVRNETYAIPEAVPEETATEDDAWVQPYGSQRGPDLDALEGATRELHRLLKMQPPTQGLQQMPAHIPSEQDKGGALLALLQSKAPASDTQPQAPRTPSDHITMNPEKPRSPHHHPAQHPPLASQDYPPPAFQLPQASGHWPPEQYLNVPPENAPPMQYNQHQPGFLPPQPIMQPTLVHPQPLPPHVQKTGVLNYTTPSPNTLASGAPMSHGAPHGAPQQPHHVPYAGYSVPQPRHSGPLTDHSKALLNVFKAQPVSNDAQTADNRNPPPYPTSDYESARGSEVYGATQPPQAVPQPQITGAMYSSQQALQGSATRGQAPGNEKHRSALLDMFKRADPNTSPRATNFGRPASGSGSNSKPSSIVGASPRIPIANLSLQNQAGSPGSKPYHSPRALAREQGAPRVSSSGSSQPLMQLLRRQEPPSPKAQQPAANATYSVYYDPAQAVPAGLSSPPAPTSFPVPVFQKQQDAPPEHKQKLLSLFGQPQEAIGTKTLPSAAMGATKRPSMDYRGGSIASGAGYATSAASNIHETDSGRGSQTPISPADRSFLLGYLQSATHQASH